MGPILNKKPKILKRVKKRQIINFNIYIILKTQKFKKRFDLNIEPVTDIIGMFLQWLGSRIYCQVS